MKNEQKEALKRLRNKILADKETNLNKQDSIESPDAYDAVDRAIEQQAYYAACIEYILITG